MAITRITNAGINDVLESISRLAGDGIRSAEVRQLALTITSNKPDEIAAIFDWVKENVRYTPDPIIGDGIELFISPIRQVKNYHEGKEMAEDCDGMAILCSSLLSSIGYRTRVAIMATGGQDYDHAICQVFSEKLNDWVNVDPSNEDFPLGWEIQYSKIIYAEPV